MASVPFHNIISNKLNGVHDTSVKRNNNKLQYVQTEFK